MLSDIERQAIIDERMLRELARPHPLDDVYDLSAAKTTRSGLVVIPGPQARGCFGVFDGPFRDGLDLVGLQRTAWMTLRAKVREINQVALSSRFTAGGGDMVGLNDVNNVARTLDVARTGATSAMYVDNLGTDGAQLVLRWGTGTTAPTSADVALTAEVDNFAASTFSRNTGAFTNTFSGSKVYAGANTMANEIGFSMAWGDNGSVRRDFLFDHALISATPINTGQTGAVSYQEQM